MCYESAVFFFLQLRTSKSTKIHPQKRTSPKHMHRSGEKFECMTKSTSTRRPQAVCEGVGLRPGFRGTIGAIINCAGGGRNFAVVGGGEGGGNPPGMSSPKKAGSRVGENWSEENSALLHRGFCPKKLQMNVGKKKRKSRYPHSAP